MDEEIMYYEPNYTSKMKSNDRIFVLEKMEGKDAVSTKGLVDNRLFTGENKLHAKLDPTNSQWYLQYDSGLVPEALRDNRWTSFGKMKEYVEAYFNKRNIRIKQIVE